MKRLKTKVIVVSLICIIIVGSVNFPLILENYQQNTNKNEKAKIDDDVNDIKKKINLLPKMSSDGISSVIGEEKPTLEKVLMGRNVKSILSRDSFSPSMSNSLKSSGESMEVSITSNWQELGDISFQNIYKANYDVLDPMTHSISIGPYGTGNGVFGSDYSVAWSDNWNNYPGGQSQFETNFPNLIEHNTFYGQCGTSVALEDPADRFKGVDLGLQNLLERIGGLQKVSYRNFQGNVDFNLYALPTSPSNILVNSQYNSEYHKPIILKVEETWEAYSMNSYQTKVYDGETETIYLNEYPLYTLYVPHIKIEFDLEPAFLALLNERGSAVDMAPISQKDFDQVMGYQEKVVNWLSKREKDSYKDIKNFIKLLQGKLKDFIDIVDAVNAVYGYIVGGLGWINQYTHWLPEQAIEGLKLFKEIAKTVWDMIKLFILGADIAETLIGFILNLELFKMKQNIEAIRAINQAKYDATLNYFKAAIYAAIQISQYILQRCQPFVYVYTEGINEDYQWIVDSNIYNAFDANSEELKPLYSYNAERWGSSAVYSTFTKPLSEITDYNGVDGVNWNDIGYDSFLTAHLTVRNEEIDNGEPRAKYYVHHCLSTLVTSLVYYLGVNVKYEFDSKKNELPIHAYSADIYYIQEDFTTGPDEIRTRIFSTFATFGCAYNVFSNTYLKNTLWSVDNAPYNRDTDGDGLMDYQEVTLGSNPYHPDSDGDNIDDGAEYVYWNNPIYQQGSTPTEAEDSDGDYFLDAEEIYWFGTSPLVFNGDLDADGLIVADENARTTNPRDPDSDDDYLIDGMEVHRFNTNPKIQDFDGDGIWDGVEAYHFMTNPTNSDTDGDGLTDYNELAGIEVTLTVNDQTINVISISDPCKSDTDGDGLGDGNEINSIGTLPGFQDTDSDGLSDGWEVSNGFDPLTYREPQFQFTYDLPINPTVQNPGAFSWALRDYYPRIIISVSIKYKAPGGSWVEKSIENSGSFELNAIAGTHEFMVTATNDQGLKIEYSNIWLDVAEDIPSGPPTVLGCDDLIYFYDDTDPHIVSCLFLDYDTIDPQFRCILNDQYFISDFISWNHGNIFSFDANQLGLNSGVYTITFRVWDDYSGAPDNYIDEDIMLWILNNNIVQQLPTITDSHKYSDYTLHGEDYRFGETQITCEQIHISISTDVIVGIWNQNPMTGEAPFEGNVRYFAIQGNNPAVFESDFYTIFTVPLPENYNPNTENYILLKWDNVNNKWIHSEFSFIVDWINGIYRFRIMGWGIFALGKYVPPIILKPDDLAYVYNLEHIVTYSLTWTLEKSMIKIPYCAIYFNFDWENPLGEINNWVEGQQINVNVDSNVLSSGVYTVTAVFFDPIANTVIRHDISLWVLPTGILSLNDMASARLYYPDTYENIPLGDLEIINLTTLGATIVGGVWDQNPMTGENPFIDGTYFAIATDVPDYRIAYNDPNYPFVISVPLPENYDPNSNILTLLMWNEAEGRWIFTDFKIEVDLSSNTAHITMGYMGIFALGVVKPDDTTPPNIIIQYLYGNETDGSSGLWNISIYDNESGNNFAATRIYIDGELVGTSCGEYKVPNTLGIHSILVEVVINNPINPILVSQTLPIDIIDDDTTPPIIDYVYTGDRSDRNPGAIIVTASDASGLSNDPSGSYPVPNVSGTHIFTFKATDGDNDRLIDNLTTTINVSIEMFSNFFTYMSNYEFLDGKNYTSEGDSNNLADLKYIDDEKFEIEGEWHSSINQYLLEIYFEFGANLNTYQLDYYDLFLFLDINAPNVKGSNLEFQVYSTYNWKTVCKINDSSISLSRHFLERTTKLRLIGSTTSAQGNMIIKIDQMKVVIAHEGNIGPIQLDDCIDDYALLYRSPNGMLGLSSKWWEHDSNVISLAQATSAFMAATAAYVEFQFRMFFGGIFTGGTITSYKKAEIIINWYHYKSCSASWGAPPYTGYSNAYLKNNNAWESLYHAGYESGFSNIIWSNYGNSIANYIKYDESKNAYYFDLEFNTYAWIDWWLFATSSATAAQYVDVVDLDIEADGYGFENHDYPKFVEVKRLTDYNFQINTTGSHLSSSIKSVDFIIQNDTYYSGWNLINKTNNIWNLSINQNDYYNGKYNIWIRATDNNGFSTYDCYPLEIKKIDSILYYDVVFFNGEVKLNIDNGRNDRENRNPSEKLVNEKNILNLASIITLISSIEYGIYDDTVPIEWITSDIDNDYLYKKKNKKHINNL